MLKLDKEVTLSVGKQDVQGLLVGIDKYSLDNFEGKKLSWVSYTLTSNKKGVYNRFWVTDWKKDGWVLWTARKKRKTSGLKMVTSRSGISKIEFSGDQGVSTPFSGVAVFDAGKNEYYAIESFTNTEVMFFKGQRITKPKVFKGK